VLTDRVRRVDNVPMASSVYDTIVIGVGGMGLAVPERQVVAWFPASAAQFAVRAFPVFISSTRDPGSARFPSLPGEGLKIGKFHHRGERVDPNLIDRRIVAGDRRVAGPRAL
jgi:hypothetical protein